MMNGECGMVGVGRRGQGDTGKEVLGSEFETDKKAKAYERGGTGKRGHFKFSVVAGGLAGAKGTGGVETNRDYAMPKLEKSRMALR
jgi:hypothetical protein